MSLIRDYLKQTTQYKNEYGNKTLVLIQVGAFFEVYGLKNADGDIDPITEIVEFSTICDLRIAEKKICVGQQDVIMAGFSHYMIDKYLRRLDENGYTTVVITQDEQAKNTTRNVNAIYSPGTYVSTEPSNNKITNNTICIWAHVDDFFLTPNKNIKNIPMIHIGVSSIDTYTGKTTIYEFQEQYIKNPTTFDDLERFIAITNPSETIIIGNMVEKELQEIINYCNIDSNSIHIISMLSSDDSEKMKRIDNSQKQTYQKVILEKFYKISDFDIFFQTFYENAIATQSFIFLLDFIYQHNPNLVNKLAEPTMEVSSEKLILANHSLKQLNIIGDNTHKGKLSSVEALLNDCITPMGKRAFSYNLLNPTTNIKQLQCEYDITEYILQNIDTFSFIKNNLVNLKDMSKSMRLLMLKRLTPKMLHQFYSSIKDIQGLVELLKKDKAITKYLKQKNITYKNLIASIDVVTTKIAGNIDLDLCKDIDTTSAFEINFIRNGICASLDQQHRDMCETFDKLEAIRAEFDKIVTKNENRSSRNTESVKIHETDKNVFRLLLTKRRATLLKQHLNNSQPKGTKVSPRACASGLTSLNYISSYDGSNKTFLFDMNKDKVTFHSQSSLNETIKTDEIEALCKDITTLKVELKEKITSSYYTFLTDMEECNDHIDLIIRYVTLIDNMYTKANIAHKNNYCKPTISKAKKSFIDAKNLRHCLIEKIQENELYVANDICLGKNLDGMLLYGTNAVGKTSLIRALGISIIMAQAGLYVPCSEFTYSPYKTIFTRILGNDNLFKGLSTFAVEMSELRTILKRANDTSLILGDELCSGTESISATSIFVAGVQQLVSKKSSFIFATHLHEIIHYDEITSLKTLTLNHMAVIYDKSTDLLIYDRQIKDGPGDNMYGLEVCKSLSLPNDFLELAHQIRQKYHPQSQSMLSLKTSHFNSKKIVGLCELCNKEMGQEVHHLQHQKDADNDGFIQNMDEGYIFHKNNIANLLTVCKKCHDEIHNNNTTLTKKKSSKGMILIDKELPNSKSASNMIIPMSCSQDDFSGYQLGIN